MQNWILMYFEIQIVAAKLKTTMEKNNKAITAVKLSSKLYSCTFSIYLSIVSQLPTKVWRENIYKDTTKN